LTAIEIMENLMAHNASIEGKGNNLRVVAPAGFLSDEIKAELQKNKEQLLKLLTPSLSDYIELLASFRPSAKGELPPVPPFEKRPERPIAWTAWWSSVERGRAS